MRGWLGESLTDIKALRASWGSVRGGWRAAHRDAAELLAHRQILVDTRAMTRDGMQVVLRTRLRLSGDTETDILRSWLEATPSEALQALATTHFRAVAAMLGGFAAALGMERLATRLTILVGSISGAITAIRSLLQTDAAHLLERLSTDKVMLAAVALTTAGFVIRMILRWRLRALFRRGVATA